MPDLDTISAGVTYDFPHIFREYLQKIRKYIIMSYN